MPSFRFRLETDGQEPTFTQWYDEPHPSPAPVIANKLRASNPDAALYIQRNNGEAQELNAKKDEG